MKTLIYILSILFISNFFRFKAIKNIKNKRDKTNLFTKKGQTLIKYYNNQIDILRFKNFYEFFSRRK